MKPILLFLFASIFGNSVMAQSTTKEEDLRPVLNHIAIYVKDLGVSTRFYEEVLNLQQIPEPFKDGLHSWFSLGDAGQLHLIQGEQGEVSRNKNEHLCFSVHSVDLFIKRLDRFKITFSNWPGTEKAPTVRVDGVKQIYFQDPDGHWLEVNDDRKK